MGVARGWQMPWNPQIKLNSIGHISKIILNWPKRLGKLHKHVMLHSYQKSANLEILGKKKKCWWFDMEWPKIQILKFIWALCSLRIFFICLEVVNVQLIFFPCLGKHILFFKWLDQHILLSACLDISIFYFYMIKAKIHYMINQIWLIIYDKSHIAF